MRFVNRRGPGLDPAGEPPDHGANKAWAEYAEQNPLTIGLFNAVRPWDYPPVALPAKQYMERALEKFQRAPGAPKLNLRAPWHGYELGYWPDLFKEIAEMYAQGEFIKAGELLLEYQTPLTDALAEKMSHVQG
jgi:4-hydroxy-3-polyprenylbenzoate decarboxylase